MTTNEEAWDSPIPTGRGGGGDWIDSPQNDVIVRITEFSVAAVGPNKTPKVTFIVTLDGRKTRAQFWLTDAAKDRLAHFAKACGLSRDFWMGVDINVPSTLAVFLNRSVGGNIKPQEEGSRFMEFDTDDCTSWFRPTEVAQTPQAPPPPAATSDDEICPF